VQCSCIHSRVANVIRAFEATQPTAVFIDRGVSLDILLQNLSQTLLTSQYINTSPPDFGSSPLPATDAAALHSRSLTRLLHPVA
jgi:hypothetical protein